MRRTLKDSNIKRLNEINRSAFYRRGIHESPGYKVLGLS